MKALLETYTFSPSTKQVTFITNQTISLERLLLITNVTTNQIIYNFANPSAGGTVSNKVLTLDYDTISMSPSDKLQIYLENGATPASDETINALADQTALMARMVKLLETNAVQDSIGRQLVRVSAMDAQPLVRSLDYYNGTTAASISSLEGGLVIPSRVAYNTLRNQLIFS